MHQDPIDFYHHILFLRHLSKRKKHNNIYVICSLQYKRTIYRTFFKVITSEVVRLDIITSTWHFTYHYINLVSVKEFQSTQLLEFDSMVLKKKMRKLLRRQKCMRRMLYSHPQIYTCTKSSFLLSKSMNQINDFYC